jgi:hypothetical protein
MLETNKYKYVIDGMNVVYTNGKGVPDLTAVI